MMVFGKSEQKKYNGYQLFALAPTNTSTGEKVSLPYTRNGITVDIANDGIGYTVRGTNTLNGQGFDIYLSMSNAFDIEAGTYTRSGKIINGNTNVELISGGGTSNGGCLEYKANKADFTFTETVEKGKSGNFIIRISPSATVNTTVYFQIEKGSVAHDYEPYTGGIPSPSQEYPQEIKSVVNPMVRVFGGTLGNKLNNKQINWLIENMNIWHDNNHFVLYDKFGTNGSVRLDICVYENNTNNYLCTFIDTDGNITTERYQIDTIDNDVKNKFIYCNMLTITDVLNISKVIDVDSNKTVGLPNNYQTATIPYTLNAIPVNSGGNVTINGQQYIADYVDVERGKLVRLCYLYKFDMADYAYALPDETIQDIRFVFTLRNASKERFTRIGLSNIGYKYYQDIDNSAYPYGVCVESIDKARIRVKGVTNKSELAEYLASNNVFLLYALQTQIEEELTTEQAQALKELSTYYPVTNITIGSEQLYGYTHFNYPISMENGWDYVKQQLNDNRDYIYDMDLQSAEAYVNSEYAVALTELEVM